MLAKRNDANLSLTQETKNLLLERIRAGHFVTRACEFAGISKPAYFAWERQARAGVPEYVALFDAIHEAEHEAEDEAVGKIRASEKEWKAQAWYLSHRFQHWKDDAAPDQAPAELTPKKVSDEIRNRFTAEEIAELVNDLTS